MSKGFFGRSLSKSEYEIVSLLALKKKGLVGLEEASGLLGIEKKRLWGIFHRLERKGWLERIERGKYLVVPFQAREGWLEHPFVLAASLAKKYYVSYRTALAHYGLTEQLPVFVYVATTERKGKLERRLQNYVFRFVRIKKGKFFGFKAVLVDGKKVFVAEKEKAIVDCLDKERYSGSIIEIAKALSGRGINLGKVKKYALKMGNSSLIRRLGYLLDLLKKDSSGLEKHIGSYRNVYLSTVLPKKALKTDRKWRLFVNAGRRDLLEW